MPVGEGSTFRRGMRRSAYARGALGLAEGAMGVYKEHKKDQRLKALQNLLYGGETIQTPEGPRQTAGAKTMHTVSLAGQQFGFDKGSGRTYVSGVDKPAFQVQQEGSDRRAQGREATKVKLQSMLSYARGKTPEELNLAFQRAVAAEYSQKHGDFFSDMDPEPIKNRKWEDIAAKQRQNMKALQGNEAAAREIEMSLQRLEGNSSFQQTQGGGIEQASSYSPEEIEMLRNMGLPVE